MAEDETFLNRWARRKAEAGEAGEKQPSEPPAGQATDNSAEQAAQDGGDGQAGTPDEDSEGPAAWESVDLEKLDQDSDYSVFMEDNVPDDVRKNALDKLWRSDPMANISDGLNDYDEDYSSWGMVTEVVKSAYQAGKGYVTEEDETDKTADDKDGEDAQTPVADATEPDDDGNADPETEDDGTPKSKPA